MTSCRTVAWWFGYLFCVPILYAGLPACACIHRPLEGLI